MTTLITAANRRRLMQIMPKFSSVQFSSVHHWPVYNGTSFEKLLQGFLLLVEGLLKFEEPPPHSTIGGPLHSRKLALGD